MLLLAVAFALMIIILPGHTVLGVIDLYKKK